MHHGPGPHVVFRRHHRFFAKRRHLRDVVVLKSILIFLEIGSGPC